MGSRRPRNPARPVALPRSRFRYSIPSRWISLSAQTRTTRAVSASLEGIPPAPRGVPHIEVTYDMDTNGILTVSAVEKGSGKSHNITITNDKGRLSQEEIDMMVSDAEKYKEEDDNAKAKVDAKNQLETQCYQMKSSMDDENMKT